MLNPLALSTSDASVSFFATQNCALNVYDLFYAYPNHPHVLKGVNFQVSVGEKVGLIGPNGAGKTSLFLAICGALSPQSGEIMLFNHPLHPGDFRPEVGLVFQNPNDQLFSLSVRDDIAFGPLNMGLSEHEVDVRVQESLMLTGVSELADRPPHHLSGGEKRMAAIASVLAMRPQLVLYDEPSANLDIRSRRRLIQFLQSAQQTILVSSHDLELILEVCDRVILLDQGEVVADGSAHEVMRNASLMEAHGLEKPNSLKQMG
ncbi:MAG: ABC transporter ATP-binding protein [Leptolyngbyaceae cyanobacterium MO_188.B28]|nr:ABC transporter ATP-binding protein [Leptolyngbyaceae cyanobacterium MO_188.B28]